MADIDDLNYKDLLNMTNDEAIEHLRQIRLQRRTVSKPKSSKSSSGSATIDAQVAAQLLGIITGGGDDVDSGE